MDNISALQAIFIALIAGMVLASWKIFEGRRRTASLLATLVLAVVVSFIAMMAEA